MQQYIFFIRSLMSRYTVCQDNMLESENFPIAVFVGKDVEEPLLRA